MLPPKCPKCDRFKQWWIDGEWKCIPCDVDDKGMRMTESFYRRGDGKIFHHPLSPDQFNEKGMTNTRTEWKEFDPKNIIYLIEDENYLVRWLRKDKTWSVPHIAYWDSEDNRFIPLNSLGDFKIEVDQYLEIPE